MADEILGISPEEEERRRRLGLDSSIGSANFLPTLGEQAIMAEDTEEPTGPTKDVPFRYTQYETNPQAMGRRARARSAAGDVGGIAGSDFILGLPVKTIMFGSGDDRFSGNVFDINAIGANLGLSQKEIDQALGVNMKDVPKPEVMQTGEPVIEDGNVFGTGLATGPDVEQHPDVQQYYAQRAYQGNQFGQQVQDLSEEQQLLKAISTMPADESIKMSGFLRGDKKGGEDIATLMSFIGNQQFAKNPENMTQEEYDAAVAEWREAVTEGRQLEGDDLMGNIVKQVIFTGVGGLFTAGLAPELGGAAAGAIGGGLSGTIQGLSAGQRGLDLLRSAGTGVGVGAGAGGLASGVGSLFGGATGAEAQMIAAQGAIPDVTTGTGVAAGVSSAQAAGSTGLDNVFSKAQDLSEGAKTLGGATAQGYAETQSMIEARNQQLMSAGQAGSAFAQGLQTSGMFSKKLPEGEFYDPIEDVLSAQQGAL
jgi:hypothetical protein